MIVASPPLKAAMGEGSGRGTMLTRQIAHLFLCFDAYVESNDLLLSKLCGEQKSQNRVLRGRARMLDAIE